MSAACWLWLCSQLELERQKMTFKFVTPRQSPNKVCSTRAITKHGVCMHSKHMHSSLASARRAKIVPPTNPQDI